MNDERRQVPYAADEPTTVLAFLDWHRDTLRAKTAGLDAAQLGAALGPSTMTLGGMLKHLAYVEDWWVGVNLAGLPPAAPFDDVDWEADEDWDWHSAVDQTPDELRALLDEFTARSDRLVAEALGRDGLDAVASRRHPHTGEGLSLRWILLHLLEEYARHNGHADLLREAVDGSVGQ